MKILVIHTTYRFRGGEDSVVDAESNLMKSNGHEVFTLFFKNPSGIIKSLCLFLYSMFNVSAYLKTIRVIKKLQPDVIHIHNWFFAASPAVIIAAYRKKIPVVYTLHNYRLLCPSAILFHDNSLFLDSLRQNFPWNSIRKKTYRNSFFQTFWLAFVVWFHKRIKTWNKIDKYVVLTDFAKPIFSNSTFNIIEKKLVVKPNFVSKTTVQTMKRNNSFLYIGRLSEEKGLLLLLDIFKKNEWSLRIGGTGPLVDDVKACTKYSNILYLGNLDKEGVLRNMQECTALIFPSLWYEGMPVTIIESFSQGLPVIASNLGSMTSMIDNGYNGLLFDSGSPVDLQEKLMQWQTASSAEKETFSKNAYQTYMEKYTPENNLNQLLAIYHSVQK